MKILELQQGSREWILARQKHFTASEAPAMMSASKNISRNELLHMKTTGTEQEFSDWFQAKVLDRGHAVEAAARPIAEKIIGDELFPATALDDDETLLASFDGITMMEDVIWECKQWNETKAEAVNAGHVPDEDLWQVVQQLAVSGAEKCLYMVTDGTEENCVHVWVTNQDEFTNKLMAGWNQFAADMKGYEKPKYEPEAKGSTVEDFPALFADITGNVENTNLTTYQGAVLARIQAINTDLQSDQDFADAESMVKFLDRAEKEIESVKKQALAKTASIDELFRTMDHLREEMRGKRLELNKLVTERKKEVKLEIAQRGRQKVDDHIAKLNEGLAPVALPQIVTDFNGAMKGKRTVATLQSAADDEVARAKIEASETAERMRSNLATLKEAEHAELFPDKQALALKEPDDLKALITARIAEAKAAEEKRLEAERERIRQEEQAKAAREAAQQASNQQEKPEEPASEKPAEKPVQAAATASSQSTAATQVELTDYQQGWIDGVVEFAHWKDGVQYVGTGGKTLKDVVDRFLSTSKAA